MSNPTCPVTTMAAMAQCLDESGAKWRLHQKHPAGLAQNVNVILN